MLELMWKEKAKRAKKNQKGFTLVELIVVVAILGILAVIGITRFAGLTDNARNKADVATAASLASAAQVYIAEYDGKFTGTTVPIGDANTPDSLVGKNLIDTPKKSRTNDGTWEINYNNTDKSLKVEDGTQEWYPAP